MWRGSRFVPVLLFIVPHLFVALYLAGCSKNPIPPRMDRATGPETDLTYAPVEADTASFRVHLYWYGYDRDGEVVRFRFAIDADTSEPILRWRVTTAHDSEFVFRVAPGDLVGGHVFWVSAEDNEGRFDPTPAKRYFSVRTVPPSAWITEGPAMGARTAPRVTFAWKGVDPDGGETGDPAPASSFEYILLRPGSSFDGAHPPLPSLGRLQDYLNLLQSSGPSMPAPYNDWKWTSTPETRHTFATLAPDNYIFAVRAVDAAGARDELMQLGRNARLFYVVSDPGRQSPPALTITSDILTNSLTNYYLNGDHAEWPDVSVPILEGDAAIFSWTGHPGPSGSPVAGFTSSIDDTTAESWSRPDPANVRITLPTTLSPGIHRLFIRAVDESGGFALAILSLEVARASFRDTTRPQSVLYVDDFAAPPGDWGSALRGSPNFPTDPVEDDWWTRVILSPLEREFGVRVDQWDAVYEGTFAPSLQREPPTLQDLAMHRVIIWSADLNNTQSNPTGICSTLNLRQGSELKAYLRGGGTLILTGFSVASQTSRISTAPYATFLGGMCSTFDPGSSSWKATYFARDFMGIDGALANEAVARRIGARDFIGARATSSGSMLGFGAVALDVGGSDAKWDSMAFYPTVVPDTRDVRLAPGLPKVEGWVLERALGCSADEGHYRRENPGLPIASPIYTYHGVAQGVLEDGAPSPREGLVVGIATQAHDDGKGDGSPVTPGSARGVTGRMVFLGFPMYYVKDVQAYQAMRAAFAYVNASPTLPPGVP